ncbi:MAG: lipopolysaccharide kinase InaA family protein [Candidatus Binatia bacterium]
MHADHDLPVRRGAMRGWFAPGIDWETLFGPDGDPDRLLGRPDCRIVKFQRKVRVGRIATRAGVLYLKRYNVFAWRVAVGHLGRPSPAERAWMAARALAGGGFAVPDLVAAVEFRRAGLLRRSFLVTREVTGGETADRWLAMIDAQPPGPRRRAARRALARALGALFGGLHAAGVYHSDLKDVNLLVRGAPEEPSCVLLDLECVRLAGLTRRRRVKNLMQLDRTLGRRASATDRLRVLAAYLGPGAPRGARRVWAGAVMAAARRKDRRRPPALRASAPGVSCIVVCQDEEAQIAACLESVRWCDEIVVVDGGSRDRTAEIARRFTDRVIEHAWPGYRAQKQFALDQAVHEWVLNLDADERVTPELATEIQRVLARVPDGVDGFAIPRLVSYLGRWWWRGGWYPRRILRLVRRRAATWGGTDPHERPLVQGRVRGLHEAILHYTYGGISDHLRAVDKLTAIAARQRADRLRVGAGRLLAEPAWRFVRSYVVRGGWREGIAGLFVAATDAFYAFLRSARIWERGQDA